MHRSTLNVAVSIATLLLLVTRLEAREPCRCYCDRRPRIVGGERVQSPAEYPFMVALLGNVICGGTLITRRHVLTAAHCIEDFRRGEEVIAVLGTTVLLKSTVKVAINIKSMVAHAEFNNQTFLHDIGIMALQRPITDNDRVEGACLPITSGQEYKEGENVTIIGFGATDEEEHIDEYLKKVEVPIIPFSKCVRRYQKLGLEVVPNTICAGYARGRRDACQGDSGGPLIKTTKGRQEVIGIVSWGYGCARPGIPGVYTKISEYVDWIKARIDNDCLCES